MALVILAENIEVAGKYELRVDAQYLLTSMASPTRARRGSNGDLWTRFFRAREQKPQCILRVARVRRSHITARELAIGCAAIFDMRGNTFADEMAGRAATRVDVLPGQTGAIQAVDGMAWQVRMRIIEANLAAITDQPKKNSCRRARRVTGKPDRRGNLNCSVALRQWGMTSKESGADAIITTAKSVVRAAASANGNSPLRAALQSWPDTMPIGWQRARAMYQPKQAMVKMTTRTPSDTAERWTNVRRKVREAHMKRTLLITTSILWCWAVALRITPTKPGK